MSVLAAPGFALRPVSPFDVTLIAALHADSFTGLTAGQVWDAKAVAEILAIPGAYGLLASAETAPSMAPVPAGFLLGQSIAGTGEILSLGMARAWRRRGGARLLLRAAIDQASEAALSRLFLEVAEDNEAALALYAAEGFSPIARRPAYYQRAQGPSASALVLARDLA
jgi:ribosomal-protein-alanine N-acetyltransferase